MNKALFNVTAATVLGLVMVVFPTWLFLAEGDQNGEFFPRFATAEDLAPPLIDDSEPHYTEAVSPREVGVIGVSLVGALMVYFFSRGRTPRLERI